MNFSITLRSLSLKRLFCSFVKKISGHPGIRWLGALATSKGSLSAEQTEKKGFLAQRFLEFFLTLTNTSFSCHQVR